MLCGCFTFSVHYGEVGVGRGYAEDEFVANERFICVHSTDGLDQLEGIQTED